MKDSSRFHTVSDIMSELGIEPLSFCRKIAGLTNFHKARPPPSNPGTPVVTPDHPVLLLPQQELLDTDFSKQILLFKLFYPVNHRRLELTT